MNHADRRPEGRSEDAETARNVVEGQDPADLERDPVADELAADPTLPDPEDDLLKREDTRYTDPEGENK